MPPPLTDDRRQLLLAAKLRALVKAAGHLPEPGEQPRVPKGAAALTTTDGAAWYLAEDDPARSLGPALVWLDRARPGGEHHVLASDVDVLALRTAVFANPPAVHRVDGTAVHRVAAPPIADAIARAGPVEVFNRERYLATIPEPARPGVDRLLGALHTIDAAAVELEAGHAIVTVRGLEVARVVVDDNGASLAIGVGKFDRAAQRVISGVRALDADVAAIVEQLRAAVVAVLERRRGDAPEHQIRSLRSERWLRARVIADPALAGLSAGAELAPAAPPAPIADLVTRAAAVAVGDGHVVVCSTGIDLDLVPTAAHAWLQAAHTASRRPVPALTIVVPARDDHPIHRRLVAHLAPEVGARMVTVSNAWQHEDG